MSVIVITFCLLYSERLTQVHLEMAVKIECTVYFKVNTNAKKEQRKEWRNEWWVTVAVSHRLNSATKYCTVINLWEWSSDLSQPQLNLSGRGLETQMYGKYTIHIPTWSDHIWHDDQNGGGKSFYGVHDDISYPRYSRPTNYSSHLGTDLDLHLTKGDPVLHGNISRAVAPIHGSTSCLSQRAGCCVTHSYLLTEC